MNQNENVNIPMSNYRYVSNFMTVLDLSIWHTYYSTGRCFDFTIIPTTDTVSLMRGFRLLYKQTDNGFCVLLSRDFKSDSINFKQPIQLRFRMRCKNDYFMNFTKLPYKVNSCFDFKPNRSDTLLHTATFVGETDLIKTEEDGVHGLISLTINDNGNMYLGQDNFEAPEYRIQFESRKVYLEYCFYGRSKLLLDFKEHFSITGVDVETKGLEFSINPVVDNSEIAYVVVRSLRPVTLKDRFSGHLVLEANSQSSKWASYRRILPWPSAKNIIKSESSSDCYAQILVKL